MRCPRAGKGVLGTVAEGFNEVPGHHLGGRYGTPSPGRHQGRPWQPRCGMGEQMLTHPFGGLKIIQLWNQDYFCPRRQGLPRFTVRSSGLGTAACSRQVCRVIDDRHISQRGRPRPRKGQYRGQGHTAGRAQQDLNQSPPKSKAWAPLGHLFSTPCQVSREEGKPLL